jgi:hypothetical protein
VGARPSAARTDDEAAAAADEEEEEEEEEEEQEEEDVGVALGRDDGFRDEAADIAAIARFVCGGNVCDCGAREPPPITPRSRESGAALLSYDRVSIC